jgi:hypothetical protein
MVLAARQSQIEHAGPRAADVLEAVHRVARDEDGAAGAGRRRLAADGQFQGALDEEKKLVPVGVEMVGRAFIGLKPGYQDGDGATGRLAAEQNLHVEAEGFD